MAIRMQHLNGHLLCVVDTETTGLISGYHDVIQVCVLPLDSNIRPLVHDGILPFVMKLKPKRPQNADPEAMKINKLSLADLIVNGFDPDSAADLFDEWFNRLPLDGSGYNAKKIAPLGQNWVFDRGFMIDWLGPQTFNSYFHYETRDTKNAAAYINDRAAFHAEPCPLPKTKLSYLASTLNVPHEELKLHDALQDCVVTAGVYRAMLTMPIPVLPR